MKAEAAVDVGSSELFSDIYLQRFSIPAACSIAQCFRAEHIVQDILRDQLTVHLHRSPIPSSKAAEANDGFDCDDRRLVILSTTCCSPVPVEESIQSQNCVTEKKQECRADSPSWSPAIPALDSLNATFISEPDYLHSTMVECTTTVTAAGKLPVPLSCAMSRLALEGGTTEICTQSTNCHADKWVSSALVASSVCEYEYA